MRYYNNGSGFTVSFSADDADNFSYSWPCSSVEGKGYFSFEASGDLCDMQNENEADGPEWAAFADDCKAYGMPKYERDQRRAARKAAASA